MSRTNKAAMVIKKAVGPYIIRIISSKEGTARKAMSFVILFTDILCENFAMQNMAKLMINVIMPAPPMASLRWANPIAVQIAASIATIIDTSLKIGSATSYPACFL